MKTVRTKDGRKIKVYAEITEDVIDDNVADKLVCDGWAELIEEEKTEEKTAGTKTTAKRGKK